MSAEHTSLAYSIIGSRSGGKVERCHAIPHLGSYSNAAHSWGVAMLMAILWPDDFPRLAYACLVHDIPESWIGDIPAPVMRHIPGLKEQLEVVEEKLMERLNLPSFNGMSPEDHAKFKACDWLEFYLWCRDQAALGNQNAEEGQKEIELYINKMGLPEPAQQVYEKLRDTHIVGSQSGVMRTIMERL